MGLSCTHSATSSIISPEFSKTINILAISNGLCFYVFKIKWNKMKKILIALTAISSTVSAAIVNGSFELPYLYPGWSNNVSAFPASAGWVVESGDIDILANGYPFASSPIGPVTTPYGEQFIDLNGSQPGAIYQDFTFQHSGEWQVRLEIQANPNTSIVKTMDVAFGVAGEMTVVTNFACSRQGPEWVTVTTPTLTVDDMTTYRLQFISTTSGNGGVLIDNVQLVSVPEPSSVAMIGLASCGGLFVRRRFLI